MNPNIQLKYEREMAILQSLDKLSYLSRSQLQKLHKLKSNRNACRVLKNMSEFLNHFRTEENIYYLNKQGRERIGSTVVRSRTPQYQHFIMRNDLYIYLNEPSVFEPEYAIEIDDIKIVPDVMFTQMVLGEERYFFGEIDNDQVLSRNKEKLDRYQALKNTDAYQKQLGYFPTLVWVVKSERRKQDLLQYGKKLKQDIYLWKDIR